MLGLTALIQCLVHDLSEEIDRGTYQYNCHPFLIRQNKWRACRYGMDARLVDPQTLQSIPARKVVHALVDRLEDRAVELGCPAQLEIVRAMADEPTGSVRQLEIFRETGDLAEVVRRMLEQSELRGRASSADRRTPSRALAAVDPTSCDAATRATRHARPSSRFLHISFITGTPLALE